MNMKIGSPTPKGFLKHAQEFFAAADLVLMRADGVSFPGYFLLGRSIELSLKAFLLHSGVPIKELSYKPYGHDLRALLNEAHHRDLTKYVTIEPLHDGVIQLLSQDYANKKFEYRDSGATYLIPLLEPTHAIARTLAFDLEILWPDQVARWDGFFD